MRGWSTIELVWRREILGAIVPATSHSHSLNALPLHHFWREFDHSAPFHLKLAFRASLWLVQALALLTHGRPWSGLEASQKQKLLEQAQKSRVFLIRQSLQLLKTVSLWAYYRSLPHD